jgi:hypothetical protein
MPLIHHFGRPPMTTATFTAIESSTCHQPLAAGPLAELTAGFLRDGIALLPGLLAARAPLLRELVERCFADPRIVASHGTDGIVVSRAFELEREFRDLMVLEPIISVAEALLGADCHMISQNILRTPKGRAIDAWHVDDGVFFPLPPEVPRHAVTPPPIILHVFIMLSDVTEDDHGPTQVVPGSHRSGRPPAADLVFEGQGPVSILGRAGDVYFHHNQTWHRGAPNRSERTRCMFTTGYGRRWASQRLWPFGDYRLPAPVLDGAGDRLRRVLGLHPHGAYG